MEPAVRNRNPSGTEVYQLSSQLRIRASRGAERLSIWLLAGFLLVLPTWLGCPLDNVPPPVSPIWGLDLRPYVGRFLLMASLGVWLFSRFINPRPDPWRLGPAFLSLPLAGLLALGFANIPFSWSVPRSQEYILHLLTLLALYLMALNAPIARRDIALPLAAGIVLQAVVALPQFALGRSVGLGILGEYELEPTWVGAIVVTVNQEPWLRAYGLTVHPNLLGGYLMAAMLVAGGYLLGPAATQRKLFPVVLGLGTAALLASFSRSAWLGVTAGALVAVALRWRGNGQIWRSLAGPVAAVLTVSTFFVLASWPLLMPRLGLAEPETEVRSVEERVLLNEAALALIEKRPLQGVGLGNFSHAVPWLVPESPLGQPVATAHNLPLLSAAELGLPGGLLWLCLMAGPWVLLGRARSWVRATPWLAGLSGAIAALSVASLLDHYVWISNTSSTLLWLLWGLWGREWQALVSEASSKAGRSPRRTAVG